MARSRTDGRLIDAASRFEARRARADADRVASPGAAPGPADESAPTSVRRILGERPDGAVDLAAWRAQWRPILRLDFAMLHDDGPADEGSLHVFHDSRSSSLELLSMGPAGSVRHVLSPADAMRLLVALNAAYGFDPRGPDGRPLSDHDDDGPGPMTA